ncbi:hypothetical protein MSG28_006605 [Choristoneura fumiferana]|uniref:Uncharacterized protein n=1 Tax=Choristoneura fumiferana TaxID=7141 RepID=A0ACC0JFM7_CHOFU|nr:hypothetical protein MSG28_006605 [Choristoneura fumiferana]
MENTAVRDIFEGAGGEAHPGEGEGKGAEVFAHMVAGEVVVRPPRLSPRAALLYLGMNVVVAVAAGAGVSTSGAPPPAVVVPELGDEESGRGRGRSHIGATANNSLRRPDAVDELIIVDIRDYPSGESSECALITLTRTGGGPSDAPTLSEVEQKFLQILGGTFGSGLPGIRVEPFNQKYKTAPLSQGHRRELLRLGYSCRPPPPPHVAPPRSRPARLRDKLGRDETLSAGLQEIRDEIKESSQLVGRLLRLLFYKRMSSTVTGLQVRFQGDPKSFWQFISSKRGSVNKQKVRKDGVILSDADSAAEFAAYFQSVYSTREASLDAEAAPASAAGGPQQSARAVAESNNI